MSDDPENAKGDAGEDAAPMRNENSNPTQRRRVKADEIAWDESHHAVPTVPPIVFFDEPDPGDVEEMMMTPEERKRRGMLRAVVRTFLQLEPRSFAEIAEEFGVTRAAVSSVNRIFLKRIGALETHDRAICRVARASRRKNK